MEKGTNFRIVVPVNNLLSPRDDIDYNLILVSLGKETLVHEEKS